MVRRGILLVAGLAAASVIGVASSPAVGAHGGPPLITVETTQPAETSVHYVVRMVYANDGDPINGKVVTATPVSPSGVEGAVVTLTPLDDGRYEGTVDMAEPGTWTVTITSVDPAGTLVVNEVRSVPATTAPAAAPPAGPASDDPSEAAAAESSDDSDDNGTVALVLVGAVAVLAAAGVAAAIMRSRKRASGADEGGTPA